jgi:hypothetical protein
METGKGEVDDHHQKDILERATEAFWKELAHDVSISSSLNSALAGNVLDRSKADASAERPQWVESGH